LNGDFPSVEDLTKPDYSDQEKEDLKALRFYRAETRRLRRSGNPAVRALNTARGKAIEVEVRKIHRRLERRIRIAERKAARS
jgi:hypothetical protein